MNRLWTPWRLQYVTESGLPKPDCIFCDALAHADREALVVHADTRAFVILNKFPYNNGHLMVVPNRHVARLADLVADELSDIMRLAQAAERALSDVYRPHGFNMGINVGRSAGAGVLDHLHFHVVPRWDGDTSFMTVAGETRVLPEELYATAARVKPALARALDLPTP